MDKLTGKIEEDLKVMRVLKTNSLHYPIARTERGAALEIVITKENPTYQFYLDASPLEKEENDAMLTIYGLK